MFFASGVSGLLYQVVWVRQLGQIVGNTLYAVALVTSVFMGGLGVGSYLAGRFVDRRPPAEGLRLYGLAELGIGGAGVGLALLLPRLSGLSASLASYRQGPEGWQVLSTGTWAFHYLVVIATLAAPCLLMGATLTLLIRYLVGTQLSSAGFRVGLLYGANTAGAALGALCSDFALIPAVGIARTQLLAVALNVIAGGAALWLCRGGAAAPTRVDATEPDAGAQAPLPWLIPGTALALVLAGFAAMGLEVVWFRYLAQLLGSLRATFSLLLAVMLVAMWLGAMAGGWLHRRYGHARLLFVVSQIALLVLVALLLGAVDLEYSQLAFRDEMRADFARATDGARAVIEVWSSLRPILMMVFLPAFLMGAVFPLANGHAQRASATVGGRAGLLYLATTLGNVLGSSLTGFVLIPMLGIRVAVWVLLGCVVASVVPMYLSGRPAEAPARDDRAFLAALGTGLVATVAFGLSPEHLLLGPSVPPLQAGTRTLTLLSEGPYETIAIVEVPGVEKSLFTNGHPMSSTRSTAQRYMRAFAHLPLLQLDAPKRAVVICFGVGNTLHATSLHPLEEIHIADLSRNILEHASVFSETNGQVLRDPRVKVYVDDGRHHLLTEAPESFDLITLEPPPIAFAGVSALYTREFYELARSRLGPRGYMTQWLPAYQVAEPEVRGMVKAFIEVFPESVLLLGADRELMLMGTTGPSIALDLKAFLKRMEARPAVKADMQAMLMGGALEVAGSFVADYATMQAATANAITVTDDRPTMEYSRRSSLSPTRLPKDLFDTSRVEGWCPGCLAEVSDLDPYLRLHQALYQSEAFLLTARYESPEGATFVPPEDPAIARLLETNPYLRRQFGGPGYDGREAAEEQLLAGRLDLALAALRRATFLEPSSADNLVLLARVQTAAGDRDAAAAAAREAVKLAPQSADAHYALGVALSRSDPAAATAALEQTVALDPEHPRANAVLCKRAVEEGARDEARRRCAIATRGGVTLSPALLAALESPEADVPSGGAPQSEPKR